MGLFHFLSLYLAIASALDAAQADVDVPTLAPPHFSQIAGKYALSSAAIPHEVYLEGPIILKVRISGTGPRKYQPRRDTLDIFPENLVDDFYLEDVSDQDQLMPEQRQWEFVYRLRPKREDVARIPELKLIYYVPQTKRFEPSFAEEIPIKVTLRPEIGPEKLALKIVEAPAAFYQPRPVQQTLRDDRPMPSPSAGMLAALWAGPPVLCFLWYSAWRRLYPDLTERRRRRRSKAARLALANLAKQPDDVPTTRAVAVDFLRQRVDYPALEATPKEVARHLQRLGVAKPLRNDWAAFFATCDRCRFAPLPEQTPRPLPAEAIRLINALEADAC